VAGRTGASPCNEVAVCGWWYGTTTIHIYCLFTIGTIELPLSADAGHC
jgi:hypothetical protein